MRILYLGQDHPGSTSRHRADALRRLGHEVLHVFPQGLIGDPIWLKALATRLGNRWLAPWLERKVRQHLHGKRWDLVWADAQTVLGPSFFRWCRQTCPGPLVSYNVDDPFSPRDGRKWDLYQRAIREDDLTAVVRNENLAEATAAGARHVVRVFRSYDPIIHAPSADRPPVDTDVMFVGTWMEDRDDFLCALLEHGIRLRIYGDRWPQCPRWTTLAPHHHGTFLHGTAYTHALLRSRIALGFLSRGNRDLHTQRSLEIPFMAGPVFCAEDTPEHRLLAGPTAEATLWRNPDDCATRVATLLADEPRRQAVVAAARQRIESLGVSNDTIMASLLAELNLPQRPAQRDLSPRG